MNNDINTKDLILCVKDEMSSYRRVSKDCAFMMISKIEDLQAKLSAKDKEIKGYKVSVKELSRINDNLSDANKDLQANVKQLEHKLTESALQEHYLKAKVKRLSEVVDAAKPLLDEELADSMTVKQNYTFVQEHMLIYKKALAALQEDGDE